MRLGRRAARLLAPTILIVACATSENVDVTGAAGSSVAGTTGTAGVTGTAGATASGGAGSVGAAGTGATTGTAGSVAGRGGTTGAAGSVAGRGGTTGSAGSAGGAAGRAGTTGSAGRGGTTGSAGRGGTGGSGGRAGAGGTTSIDGGTATFTQVYTSVISANCFGSACHNPSGGGRPNFSSQSSCYTYFKNQGQLYPGMDPQKSYIYFIMHGDPSATPPSPPYMPPDPNPKVSADGLAIVAAWIAAGALNN
jgi:hypothetical protein